MSRPVAYDDIWPPALATRQAQRLQPRVRGYVTVHHIGSTAIPGLPAKPILDLIPVFESDAAAAGADVEAMGYEWMAASGFTGRRSCRRSDPECGKRLVHAHRYVQGHADIRRHLAFRDALRANTALRVANSAVKGACAARHPGGGDTYGTCKSAWIVKTGAKALERER